MKYNVRIHVSIEPENTMHSVGSLNPENSTYLGRAGFTDARDAEIERKDIVRELKLFGYAEVEASGTFKKLTPKNNT